jgi:putative Mn2+ efflux pump MntP
LQPEKLRFLLQTEIGILTLAVIADSFTIAWFSSALHNKLAVKLDAKLPLAFSSARTVFMAVGLGAGFYAAALFPDFSSLTGLFLLSIVGIKLGIESVNFNPEEKVILIDNHKTMVLLAIAGSANTFFAGIALGLAGVSIATPLIIVLIVTALLTYAGIKAGKYKGYKPRIKYTGLVSGVVIVAIVIRHLVQHFLI